MATGHDGFKATIIDFAPAIIVWPTYLYIMSRMDAFSEVLPHWPISDDQDFVVVARGV